MWPQLQNISLRNYTSERRGAFVYLTTKCYSYTLAVALAHVRKKRKVFPKP